MPKFECPQCNTPRELKRKPLKDSVCLPCKYKNTPKSKSPKVLRYRICKECGDKKKATSIRESQNTTCKECYTQINIKSRTRVCIVCKQSQVMLTSKDAEAKRCKSCVQKTREIARNKKPIKRK